MPRSAGWSCFTTTCWWCFNPSASRVRRSGAGRPNPERICRMRSTPVPGGGKTGSVPRLRLRYFRVGGFLAMRAPLLAWLVGDRLHVHAALLRHASRRREPLQCVDRGPHHVMRVGGAEALGEDVAYPGALEHRTHRSPRNHAGSGRSRLEEHATRPMISHDVVRNRAPRERDLHDTSTRT